MPLTGNPLRNVLILILLTNFIPSRSSPQAMPEEFNTIFRRAEGCAGRFQFDSAIALGYTGYNGLVKMRGRTDAGAVRFLMQIALTHMRAGREDSAEILIKRVLAVRERLYGPKHRSLFEPLLSLANVYRREGMYREAGACLNRAKNICIATRGKSHPEYGKILEEIAEYDWEQGKAPEAEQGFREAGTVLEKTLKPGSLLDLLECLDETAAMESDLGHSEQAEALYRKALSLKFLPANESDPLVARTAMKLAQLLLKRGVLSEVESLLVAAQEMQRSSYQGDHPDLARSTLRLAEYYHAVHKENLSDSAFRETERIVRETLGERNSLMAECLMAYSRFCRDQNRLPEALQFASRTLSIVRDNFLRNAGALRQSDALASYYTLRSALDLFVSLARRTKMDDPAMGELVATILATKGLASDFLIARSQPTPAKEEPALRALRERFRLVRYQLAEAEGGGFVGKNVRSERLRLDSLENVSAQLESELARRSVTPSDPMSHLGTTLKVLSSRLPDRATLVEFLKYQDVEDIRRSGRPRYLAVLLHSDGTFSHHDLGFSGTIDALVALYQKHLRTLAAGGAPISDITMKEFWQIVSPLYNQVWKPFAAKIAPGAPLFISPDGSLNLLSFASLMDDQGKYLVESHPIHYLTAGRDLAREDVRGELARGLVGFGNPDYNASVRLRSGKKKPAKGSIASAPPDRHEARNVRPGCGVLNELRVDSLPGTKKEVLEMVRSWRKEHDLDTTRVFLGSDASEEQFKRNAPGHHTIHIATHGYCVSEECGPGTQWVAYSPDSRFVGENPLLLSGLLLAGANLHGKGADSTGAEDGMLTAAEVSAMDLKGTELVLLSTCESNLGTAGEEDGAGILQRAFQMAGARAVVSPLWELPEEETMRFMDDLFSGNAASLPELIQKAALKRIAELRAQGKYAHPYIWGGFTGTGDWKIR
jgi:CHAT domain-containing protein/tetratricopeptide (TPR) repeat protein